MSEHVIRLHGGKQAQQQTAVQLQALPPLALYIHLPWCIKKCPYCDFNSHESKSGQQVPEQEYLSALMADLDAALPLVWGRPVYSIFIGGGTPSLFSPQAIDQLLAGVRARVKLAPDAEVTLEANPGTFEAGRFKGYRAAGVNRLSIGVQSFDDEKLEALGRVHSSAQAHAAIEEAAKHFDTFNLDVMYALPGQTLAQCRADVQAALRYTPPHLSLYHLTLEPNTYFAKFPPQVPSDDDAAEMQDLIEAITAQHGYQHYEVSAYARPGHRCQHNLNYWQFGDYLGIGAGAHSKLSFHNRIVRQARHKQPAAYMAKALQTAGGAIEIDQAVSVGDLPFEFMLNALRLTEGVSAALFAERTGQPLITIQRQLREAAAKGLLEDDAAIIKPTTRGQAFLNDLQQMFL
jgi:oxygen-independent coproporphyrinogen-3 oxidase